MREFPPEVESIEYYGYDEDDDDFVWDEDFDVVRETEGVVRIEKVTRYAQDREDVWKKDAATDE